MTEVVGRPQKILIVRTDRIGDVVLTMPAVRLLRRACPEAHLAMLVSPATRDLVKGNPDLDEIFVDDRAGAHKGWGGFVRLVREVREKRFDTALNFHTKRRTNLLCRLAGIPRRVGYENNKWGFLLTDKIPDARPQGLKHETRYCADVLQRLGIFADQLPDPFIPTDPAAEQWADDWLARHQVDRSISLVAVHPSASCPTRQWPLKRFARLMNNLSQKRTLQFVLVGGGGEAQASAREILQQLAKPAFNATGQTSLPQLVSLLRRCQMMISNDSGPVHVADAVGTPVVSIFTRNQPGINPERWCPLSAKSRVVAPPVSTDISFAKGKVLDPAYLDVVTVDTVEEAVDAIYKLC